MTESTEPKKDCAQGETPFGTVDDAEEVIKDFTKEDTKGDFVDFTGDSTEENVRKDYDETLARYYVDLAKAGLSPVASVAGNKLRRKAEPTSILPRVCIAHHLPIGYIPVGDRVSYRGMKFRVAQYLESKSAFIGTQCWFTCMRVERAEPDVKAQVKRLEKSLGHRIGSFRFRYILEGDRLLLKACYPLAGSCDGIRLPEEKPKGWQLTGVTHFCSETNSAYKSIHYLWEHLLPNRGCKLTVVDGLHSVESYGICRVAVPPRPKKPVIPKCLPGCSVPCQYIGPPEEIQEGDPPGLVIAFKQYPIVSRYYKRMRLPESFVRDFFMETYWRKMAWCILKGGTLEKPGGSVEKPGGT